MIEPLGSYKDWLVASLTPKVFWQFKNSTVDLTIVVTLLAVEQCRLVMV